MVVNNTMVDNHATEMRYYVAFQASTRTVGNHRNDVSRADLYDLRHLLGSIGKYHDVGPVRVMPRLVLAVRVEDRSVGGNPVTEQCLEFVGCGLCLFSYKGHDLPL